MTADPLELTYGRRVKKFVLDHCSENGQTLIITEAGVPKSTLSQALQNDRSFGSRTHGNIVRWLEDTARDLHVRGLPLELDGLEMPLTKDFLASLDIVEEEEDTDRESVSEAVVEAGASGAAEDVDADVAVAGDEEAAGGEREALLVPPGVSILQPGMRDRPQALWLKATSFENAATTSDLARVFDITLANSSDLDNQPFAGWLGPLLPEGSVLDEDTLDRIDDLIRQWQTISATLETLKRRSWLHSREAPRYCTQLILETEEILIGKFWMTHPDNEFDWDPFQRDHEIDWRAKKIRELERYELPSAYLVFAFGIVMVGNAVRSAVSAPAGWFGSRGRRRR